MVTIFSESQLGQQDAYNKYLPIIKPDVKWLGVLDMDEFLYSKESDNIKDILKTKLTPFVCLISIQMTIFLPATFTSPNSIIQSNTLHSHYDSKQHPKCIYSLNKLCKVRIHGYKLPLLNHKYIKAIDTLLCINHYRYISFEYLYGIKEGRGGGVHKHKYNHKNKFMDLASYIDNGCVSNDSYLCDKSQVKKDGIRPMVDLYPNSTWLYLKNKHPEDYKRFKSYHTDNTILNRQQIKEISLFMNSLRDSILTNKTIVA